MSQVRSLATAPHCPPAGTLARLRSIFSGSVGNLIEYYDWYVYSAFSLYFAKVFFPSGSQTVQLLNTAAIFAVGFVMRPIGGWLVGLYADRKGRKAALLVSVLAMCAGSLIIGLTPGYGSIGIAAPVLLVLARLLQGLSLGGEYASSATYLSEMADKTNRGFYSSFLFATLSLGQLLAMAVLVALQQFFLSAAQLESWGWRIPFLIGSLAAGVAIFLRRNMEETESFEQHRQSRRSRTSVAELFRHKRVPDRRGPDARRHRRVLRIHDVHAEIPRQQRGDEQGGCVDGVRREPDRVRADATGVRQPVGPRRASPAADRLRRARHAVHGSDLQRADDGQDDGRRARADLRGAADREPLFVRQRGRESRAVPGRDPRARRRAALRDHGVAVRRHGRVHRAVDQEHRPRDLVLLWYVSGCVLVSLLCYLWMPDPKTVSCIDRD